MTKTIIAIDDSPIITDTIRKMFSEEKDIMVITAEDAFAGMEKIQNLDYKVDLIILDYHMPKMTGIEMLRKIKEHRPDFPVPVLMLTTQLENKSDEARKLGVVSWILKPIHQERLQKMIPQVFQHYPVRYS